MGKYKNSPNTYSFEGKGRVKMISNIDIMINEYEATLSKQIKLYRGDSLTLSFALSNSLISRIESEDIIDGMLPLDGSITAKVLI